MATAAPRRGKRERDQVKLEDVLYADDEDAEKLYVGGLELMGTWEVHRYLGIERSRIARWLDENEKGRQAIAEPVARLKSGPFWTFPQIRNKARQMYVAEMRTDPVAHPVFTEAELDAWLEKRRQKRAALAA